MVGCTGFDESNETAVEDLLETDTASCAVGFNSSTPIKVRTATGEEEITVLVCLSDPSILQEDDCRDNTGVIVIAIICCVALLVILGLVVYWIRYDNNKKRLQSQGDIGNAKFTVNPTQQ